MSTLNDTPLIEELRAEIATLDDLLAKRDAEIVRLRAIINAQRLAIAAAARALAAVDNDWP